MRSIDGFECFKGFSTSGHKTGRTVRHLFLDHIFKLRFELRYTVDDIEKYGHREDFDSNGFFS